MGTPEKEIENTKELAKKLTSVVKVSKEQKEKTYKKLFINFIIAIVIFVYFFVLNNILFVKLDNHVFEKTMYVISAVMVLGLIVEIEIAYRKDNDSLAVHGMELFVITMLTIFMPYVFLHRGQTYKFLYSLSSMYIAIYYSLKCLIIYLIDMKKYKNELSDVKELVNEPKKESYLDEKSKRKFAEPVEEENQEVVEEKDPGMLKLERMQARIRENQERRKQVKQAKKDNKEKEAVEQKRKEKYKPLNEEKTKNKPIKEEKPKEVVKETKKTKTKKEEKLEPIKEGETLKTVTEPPKKKRGRPKKVKEEPKKEKKEE